ncbi:hypothetical protein QTN47_08815 [Danxiaibacter flavus]|uniref:Outer membrane protein beta-barrel domain-containing protein n=1 Tax=Danxiaibacter flavus TaxID=3049108 RepID=A0ABV3ZDC1_9BACT|nr:hypothetical protein QNM32_08815 [Chitinophagaceae bacterium DXS]
MNYFTARMNSNEDDISLEYGKLRIFTCAFLAQTEFSKKLNHSGLFAAAGVALQKKTEDYLSQTSNDHLNKIYPTLAIRTGYMLPVHNALLSIEVNATGPYVTSNNDEEFGFYQQLEVVTQLSLGVRLIW